MGARAWAIASAVGILIGSFEAAAECGAPLPDDVRAAAECPRLFGHEGTRRINRELRQNRLEALQPGAYAITLVHRGDYVEPEEATLRGLTVAATVEDESCTPVALVEIDDDNAFGCGAGLYAVRTDDSLGMSARVLGVLDGHLLIEHEGILKYVSAPGSEPPVFRLVWHPPWRFARPVTISSQPPSNTRQTTTRPRSTTRRR